MNKKILSLVFAGSLIVGLAACASESIDRQSLMDEAHFWERARVTETAYMEGPKVQQMLNRDIARCVTELRELERLGMIRHTTPADNYPDGSTPDPDTPEGALAQWDTPEHDGYLRAEHLPYHDFETCMQAKGWERLEYVPYDVANESRKNYIKTVLGEQYRTKYDMRKPKMVAPDVDGFSGVND